MKKRFIAEFEPIRGLAALTVALMHSFYVFTGGVNASTATSIAKVVFNGFAAVTVFFLLSGVVLGMALDRYPGTFVARWRQFLILRVFRIYPMTILVVAVICAYLIFFHQQATYPNATEWFDRYYREELSLRRVVQNLLLINVSLNPVGWTLTVEIAMAAIFPALHRLARNSSLAVNMLVLAFLCSLSFLDEWFRSLAPDNPAYVLFCEIMLPHAYKFYLGLLLPTYVNRNFVARVSANAALYFTATIVVVVFARTAIPRPGGSADLAILIESLAAACLLAPFCTMAENGISARLLHTPAIRWLGRVSYSFYLWHFTVLYVTATLMFRHLPSDKLAEHPFGLGVALAVCSIAVTCLLSELSYRFVELKYMEYGRELTRSLALRSEVAHDA